MQAQARICPVCKDDHSKGRACKPEDLAAEIARLKADYARAEETLRIEIAETAAQRRRSNKAERDRDEARGAIKEVYWTAKASIEATHTSEWISPRFLVQLLEPFVMPNPPPEPETEE